MKDNPEVLELYRAHCQQYATLLSETKLFAMSKGKQTLSSQDSIRLSELLSKIEANERVLGLTSLEIKEFRRDYGLPEWK